VKGQGDGGRPLDMREYRVGSEGGGARVKGIRRNFGEKGRLDKVCRVCVKTDGIRRCGRNRGNVGGVSGERGIWREASDEVKGERVSWEAS